MEPLMTVENISDAEFRQLQMNGWLLVCVDRLKSEKIVFSFRKVW